ncbi:MAG TPA: HAMP domain-containing histidine kinase [Candidatus Faecousia intestinigallinarum]|nr:HAMP domain-containing histidine kinase [Candidatus Faecousia intestinigallinarum]
MKYSIAAKMTAVILCAVFLALALGCGGALVALGYMGLLDGTVEEAHQALLEQEAEMVASSVLDEYAYRTLSNCPEELLEMYWGDPWDLPPSTSGISFTPEKWSYIIWLGDTRVSAYGLIPEGAETLDYSVVAFYPQITGVASSAAELRLDTDGALQERYPGELEIAKDNVIPANYQFAWGITGYDGNDYTYYGDVQQTEGYTVSLYAYAGAYTFQDSILWQLAGDLQPYWSCLAAGGAVSLLLFAGLLVFLCCAAGRKAGREEAEAAALNAMPLDLYAWLAGWGVFLLGWVALRLLEGLNDVPPTDGYFFPVLLAGLAVFCGCLLLVGFLFALAAQIKMGGGHWWRHSVFGWILRLCGRAVGWLGRCAARLYCLLPLSWQWLLVGAGMLLALVLAMASYRADWIILAALLDFAVVIYGVYCFGKLHKGAKAMSRGNLGAKISPKHLMGSFRDFAGDLNALGEAAMVAAQRQMKSERMKTELITNVSHDIKTPLTSIINYVDLLQKAQTREEAEQYLEVLSRQSQRMKKLIEDLMEMSKAATGNIQADIQPVDAAEAVNQALGEFSDKLKAARLTPVLRMPEEPARVLADGRLLWRVLSNLLNNAVKYAMPDTRLYIDVVQLELAVTISLKNISREALGVDAEELMERFVRGDASRNTEGSGLGLNIAKSLMELQHGQLKLLVDGDLFKATLYFPIAPEAPEA